MERIKAIGIDAGSTAIKVVGINEKGNIVFYKVEPTSFQMKPQLEKIIEELPKDVPIGATGYGGDLIGNATITASEIRCHSKGAHLFLKGPGTVIDIGGQDSKVIVIDQEGEVIDFTMNDKCAAGTGRFLETTAWRLKTPVEEMARFAEKADREVQVSSVCAVFAESEVISMVAKGEPMEAVIKGLHRALAKRVASLAQSLNIIPPILLSGGVAQNPVIKSMLEEELKEKIIVPPYPQLMGALGAAIISMESKTKVTNR